MVGVFDDPSRITTINICTTDSSVDENEPPRKKWRSKTNLKNLPTELVLEILDFLLVDVGNTVFQRFGRHRINDNPILLFNYAIIEHPDLIKQSQIVPRFLSFVIFELDRCSIHSIHQLLHFHPNILNIKVHVREWMLPVYPPGDIVLVEVNRITMNKDTSWTEVEQKIDETRIHNVEKFCDIDGVYKSPKQKK
jgi:hypothetical protein